MPKHTIPQRPHVSRKQYNQLWAAAALVARMLHDMEEAGALRLPFIGYEAARDNLKATLEAEIRD